MRETDILRQIDRYQKGKLNEQEIDKLWEEFLKNPEYLEWLEIEVSAREYYRRKKKNRIDDDQETAEYHSGPVLFSSGYKKLVYAAAVFCILIFGLYYIFSYSDSSPDSKTLASIDVHEMITADIYRSDQEGYDPVDIRINSGFEAAVSGRLAESKEQFISILNENPTSRQTGLAGLNLGILQYNDYEYEQAAASFRIAVTSESLENYNSEKSYWYLGNSLIQTGNYGDAYDVLSITRDMNGQHKKPAEQLLESLREYLDSDSQ